MKTKKANISGNSTSRIVLLTSVSILLSARQIYCFESTLSAPGRRQRLSSSYDVSIHRRRTRTRVFSNTEKEIDDSIAAASAASIATAEKNVNRIPNNNNGQSNNDASNNTFVDFRKLERQIVKLGRSGKTDDAILTYESIPKIPTVRIMNAVIDACSRARPTRLTKAFDILHDGVTNKNIKPNVYTFGSLMNACSRARDANRALELLNTMKQEYNVEPNGVVYSAAISACARAEPTTQHTKALELLREAIEENNIEISVVGFNAAVAACAQAGDYQRAISILTRMEEANKNRKNAGHTTTDLEARIPAPDAITYGTVFAACERGEQWSLILKYAKSMEDHDVLLDGISVTSCLHACQQLGLAEEALYYLDMMKLVHSQERMTAGWKRSGARRPLEGPDPVAYRLAISACARGGEWEDGIRLLDEFKDVTGKPADVVAYTSAITGCEYAGQWRDAFLLLEQMRQQGVKANEVTMAAVMGACATALAKRNKTKKDEGDDDDEVRTSGMLEPQVRALQLLNVLRKDDSVVNPNIQVYNAAIRVCAEAGDLDRAFKLLEQVKNEDIERTVVTYGSLMTACERVGDVEGASKVFRAMKVDEITPNEIIYGAAISCCRKGKEPERALLLLRKMIQEELSPNAATFNTVIVAQTEGKSRSDMERAILVYKLMKSQKYATDNARPNRQTYSLLVNFFATKMQPNMAEAFLVKMRGDGFVPDVDLFTMTVTAYERTGQPLKALNLMESMQSDGYDFYGVKVLNAAFKKAVQVANAVGKKFDDDTDDAALRLNDPERDGDEFIQKRNNRDNMQ